MSRSSWRGIYWWRPLLPARIYSGSSPATRLEDEWGVRREATDAGQVVFVGDGIAVIGGIDCGSL